MNSEITNIAIKIGEFGTKASFALGVAIIGALASIICAIIAGYFAWKLNKLDKEYQKQWAYINRRSWLIDQAIEISIRMLFNKLLIVDHDDKNAIQNFFLLQKDALVIKSQMVVYAPQEVAGAFYDFKNLIISTPNDKFRQNWSIIYENGSECLLICRKHLGNNLSENFKDFSDKLTKDLPTKDESSGIVSATVSLGSVSNSSSFSDPKPIN